MIERALAVVAAAPFVLGSVSAPTPPPVQEVFTFADPQVVESSGLVVTRGLFVTVNDSGDSGRVFAVDPATGETVGTTSWDGAPSDAEALAPAPGGEVWVGDIGDNRAGRASVEVLRVPVGRGHREVDPESYELVYPDGPQDAESLLVEPGTGRLVVVSKSFFGGRVYVAPRELSADRPNRLRALGPAPAIATDAAFLPGGRHLVVRDYTDATVLTWPALETVAELELPDQEQGEAIAVDARGRWFVSTEGQFTPVLRVPVPAAVRAALAPPEPSGPVTGPATDGATGHGPGTGDRPLAGSDADAEAGTDAGTDTGGDRWRWVWLAATAALAVAVAARVRRRR